MTSSGSRYRGRWHAPATVGGCIQRPRFQLYPIASDPFETKNLASDPAHTQTLTAYQKLLRKLQEDSGDRWVSKWEYE